MKRHHHLAMFIARVIITTNRSEAFVLLQTPKNYGNKLGKLWIALRVSLVDRTFLLLWDWGDYWKLQMIFIPVMILYGASILSSVMDYNVIPGAWPESFKSDEVEGLIAGSRKGMRFLCHESWRESRVGSFECQAPDYFQPWQRQREWIEKIKTKRKQQSWIYVQCRWRNS